MLPVVLMDVVFWYKSILSSFSRIVLRVNVCSVLALDELPM